MTYWNEVRYCKGADGCGGGNCAGGRGGDGGGRGVDVEGNDRSDKRHDGGDGVWFPGEM